MKRNPELAHKVTQMPEVAELRHTAIDKITSAALAAQLLGRQSDKGPLDPVKELETEIRLNELLDDAGYYFRIYLRDKVTRYEDELHKTIAKGNEAIKAHSSMLDDLKKERGIQ